MHSYTRTWIVALVVTACAASQATAANWWPWGSKNSKTTQHVPSTRSTGTPLVNGRPVLTSSSSPSMTDKLANGAKKAASTTADIVTLKPLRDKWSSSKRDTGRQGSTWSSQPPTRKSSESASWWPGSWFKPKEEKKIKTVGDWMAQPMPKY